MEFNGDIVRQASGGYVYNSTKLKGIPSPGAVWRKGRTEFGEAFTKKGTNDHGIGFLVGYTLQRFFTGFLAASVIAVLLGVAIGLSPMLYTALNPFIQLLKPISPLAWMPLLLYSVKNPFWTAILVVFMASLWPTVANTAFGVSTIRKDYLRVATMIEMSFRRRLFRVILPGAAPAIFAGLRISFGSALVAVVPAEMLLGELGIGYLSWIEWNNLDVAGVIFAIGVVGLVGVALDTAFTKLAAKFTYAEG
jgi:nitrate/nitrite transport system permease protein